MFTPRTPSATIADDPVMASADGPWPPLQHQIDEQRRWVEDEFERVRALVGSPDAGVARSLLDLAGRIDRLEKYVIGLTSQQGMLERQMELNARATALERAIEYAGPAAVHTDPQGADVTSIAEGFLAWLKASRQ